MTQDEILKTIADNLALFDAVKAMVLSEFDELKVSAVMTNEQLGEITRAKVQGREAVETAFKKIALFKTGAVHTTSTNPAR